MADYPQTKNIIDNNIVTNHNEDITAVVLNMVLTALIDYTKDVNFDLFQALTALGLKVGDLNNLNTDDKSSIVNAINEILLAGLKVPERLQVTNGTSIPLPAGKRGDSWYIDIFSSGVPDPNGSIWLGGLSGIIAGQNTWIIAIADTIGGDFSLFGSKYIILNGKSGTQIVTVVDYASLPPIGKIGVLYITLDTGNTYYWDLGVSDYIQIGTVVEGTLISPTVFEDLMNTPVIPDGTKIYLDTTSGVYYRWDGASFAPIVSSTGGGSIYIELTKTQLDTAIANSELVPGTLYKITEVETWMKQGDTTKAIYLHAISANELEKKGTGEFYVPKYDQGVGGYGIWSGELWQKTSGAMGVEPSYSADDVVIWGGKHWKNLTGNYGTFIDHYELDSVNWEEIPVNDTDYNVRTNIVEYDYANDMITYRKDDVGNEISTSYRNWGYLERYSLNGDPLSDSNYNPTKIFQWGNEYDYDSFAGVGFNIVENGVFECVNQRGIIYNNTLDSGLIYNNTINGGHIYNNTINIGSIYNNTLENIGLIYNNTLNNGSINNNTINIGAINFNTLDRGGISNNTLNNGYIEINTINGGSIQNNTIESFGRISKNTLNGGRIENNALNNKQIQNLIINKGRTDTDLVVEEAVNATGVTTAYEIDLSAGAGNFNLTLSGATNLTFSNMISEFQTAVISLSVTGNYSLSFPIWLKPMPANDDYDGSADNEIVINIKKGGVNPIGYYSLTKIEL